MGHHGERRSRRAGVDTGGTFTDFVVLDEATGAFAIGKTLTTPDDPSQAIETGLGQTLRRAGAALSEVGQIDHLGGGRDAEQHAPVGQGKADLHFNSFSLRPGSLRT